MVKLLIFTVFLVVFLKIMVVAMEYCGGKYQDRFHNALRIIFWVGLWLCLGVSLWLLW